MQYPTDANDAHRQIHEGRLIQVMMNTPGYLDVFKPILAAMLKDADIKCHNFKLREDRGKYAIVRYNTLEEIMTICETYIENMESAIQYCKDEGIDF